MPKIAYIDASFTEAKLAKIEQANEIVEEYQQAGFVLSLRQLYYQHVARGLIENTERSYKNLGNLVNDARMAGLIDWYAIEDRGRGIKPWLIEEDETEVLSGIEYGISFDYWERQNAYVEVWVEKDALSSVIERPARRYRVPYMPCKGYLSASEAWRSGRRFREMLAKGRRCVVIHLGDHDPSGIDMSRDNRDRLSLFGEANVELRRIALNMDQVEEHRPPPNPAKVTDSRAADYIERFGTTSWELDALRPQFLESLIADEIRTLIDEQVWSETAEEEAASREVLAKLGRNWGTISEHIRENY